MATTVRWLSGITMALVLIQAVLIGQGLFLGDPSRTTLHGWIGNSVLVVVLTVAQIGLGYSGRGGGVPAALHIPNGVLIATLLAALLTVSFWPSPRAEQIRP